MVPRESICAGGPEFSRLAYGTWRILGSEPTPAEILDRLKTSADCGITTIDTAEIYGTYRVEEALGAALRIDPGFRNRIEIVSKCGIQFPCPAHPECRNAHYDATAANIVSAAEKSLRLLGTDRLDLFLIHRPDWLTPADETAKGLNKLLRDGKILAAGVSNFTVHQFELLNSRMDRPLATNQIEFSLLQMDSMDDGVLDQCQRLRILPMAWSPFAGGQLFSTENPASDRIRAAAAEISVRHGGATLEQLALAWIMAHPSRPIPVLGTNQPDRIRAAAKAASIKMDRQDWFALWTAAKGHRIP